MNIVDNVSAVCQPFTKRKNTAKVRLELWMELCTILDDLIENDVIDNYNIVCNRSNNTPTVLANNQLVVDVTYYLNRDSDGTDITCTIHLNSSNPYEAFDRAMEIVQ